MHILWSVVGVLCLFYSFSKVSLRVLWSQKNTPWLHCKQVKQVFEVAIGYLPQRQTSHRHQQMTPTASKLKLLNPHRATGLFHPPLSHQDTHTHTQTSGIIPLLRTFLWHSSFNLNLSGFLNRSLIFGTLSQTLRIGRFLFPLSWISFSIMNERFIKQTHKWIYKELKTSFSLLLVCKEQIKFNIFASVV